MLGSLFYRYYSRICSYKLAELVYLPYFCRKSTQYSDRLYDFSVKFKCKDIKSSSFLVQLDFLSLEDVFLNYLNNFKSRVIDIYVIWAHVT